MPTGEITVEDPNREHRLAVAAAGAIMMVAGGLFTGQIILYDDGGHGAVWTTSWIRALVIVGLGIAGFFMARSPNRPDVRVVRSGMLAVGLVALVVGLDAYLRALDADDKISGAAVYPGPQAWALLAAALCFLYLRWRGSVWPESRWQLQISAARERRRGA